MTLVADFNSSVNVPFQRMRRQQQDAALQEGVVGASDLMVVQRGAGANLSVDVGAGFAWVQLDTGTNNGLAHVSNDATANVAITTANATNPRIDQIILRWNDSSIPTGSGNVPTLEVLTGTATAGATLANRTGATALPNDCLRLADVLVPALDTTIDNTQIRDRRPWARGAYVRLTRISTDYTTTSATFVEIDATNFKPRIECSGVPLRVMLNGTALHSVDGANIRFSAAVDGTQETSLNQAGTIAGAGGQRPGGALLCYDLLPSAGSHQISPMWATSGATATLAASSGTGLLEFVVEEIVRQNTANNTTTSG